MARNPMWKDRAGQVYGRLTAKHEAAPYADGRSRWVCECECGAVVEVIGTNLATGNTRSCGCLQIDESGRGRGSRTRVRKLVRYVAIDPVAMRDARAASGLAIETVRDMVVGHRPNVSLYERGEYLHMHPDLLLQLTAIYAVDAEMLMAKRDCP